MKIGIIGPNSLTEGSLKERKVLIDTVAKIIAKSGHEIILTPDKDSLLEYFGKKYLEFKGKKITIVAPTEEDDYKDYLNTEIGEIHSSKDWDRQADEFVRQSDLLLCIGYAWGGMKEIACAKYSDKKKVYLLKEFISTKLPKELNFIINYIPINEIER